MAKVINLDKKSLKDIGDNGKNFANQEFSKEILIKNLEQIFINLSKNYSFDNK